MRLLLFFLLILVSNAFAFDHVLIKQCISPSGSIYDLEFDLDKHSGEVRYRWMGQDIFYALKSVTRSGSKIAAVAEFSDSRSGEDKGSTWVFGYNMDRNILIDMGNEYTCK